MEFLLANMDQIGAILVGIVGAASALSGALRKFARITPNDADDELASRMMRMVGIMQKLLDRLALNPDQQGARKPKERK